jgi:hypothetical protein
MIYGTAKDDDPSNQSISGVTTISTPCQQKATKIATLTQVKWL